MAKTKVAGTLDSQTLRRVDRLVRDARYPNRSQAIEGAVAAPRCSGLAGIPKGASVEQRLRSWRRSWKA